MSMRPALAAAIVLFAATACDRGSDGGAEWETITAQAGDTTIVRTVGASDEAALLQLEPEVRIGEFEGADEYQFADVAHVIPAPDGGVYTFDRTLVALRHYDAEGRYVRTIGRRGGGPGEYERSNGIATLPDGRLILWDPANTRVNLYDTDGEPAGSWRFASGLNIGGPGGVRVDTAGSVYLMHWFQREGADVLPGENTGYMVLGPDGVVRDSVFPPQVPFTPARVVASREGSTNVNSVPFAPQRSWTLGPHGRFAIGVSDRYAITFPGADGRLLRVERDVEQAPVDPDERANQEERITANMRNMDPSWRWNGPPIPDRKAYFSSLQLDADGRLWVSRGMRGERIPADSIVQPSPSSGPPRPPMRWRSRTAYDVFARDGRFLGHLPVPQNTTLTYMQGDRVWGVQRDELDVPYVMRWRIVGLRN